VAVVAAAVRCCPNLTTLVIDCTLTAELKLLHDELPALAHLVLGIEAVFWTSSRT
jgi:hypothetical protein